MIEFLCLVFFFSWLKQRKIDRQEKQSWDAFYADYEKKYREGCDELKQYYFGTTDISDRELAARLQEIERQQGKAWLN